MKKSYELILNAFLNIAVALIVGGILKLAFDFKGFAEPLIVILSGSGLFIFVSILLIILVHLSPNHAHSTLP